MLILSLPPSLLPNPWRNRTRTSTSPLPLCTESPVSSFLCVPCFSSIVRLRWGFIGHPPRGCRRSFQHVKNDLPDSLSFPLLLHLPSPSLRETHTLFHTHTTGEQMLISSRQQISKHGYGISVEISGLTLEYVLAPLVFCMASFSLIHYVRPRLVFDNLCFLGDFFFPKI